MRLSLTVTSGPDSGVRLRLIPGDTRRVGRGKDADLVIGEDSDMSRLHFSIECAETGAHIRDLGSSNGTLLNGRPVVEGAVVDGDEIVAGQTKLVVRIEKEVPREPALSSASPRQPSEPPLAEAQTAHGVPQPSGVDRRGLGAAAAAPVADLHPTNVTPPPSTARRPYGAALVDGDPSVRREALLAAAWAGEKWLPDHCTNLARRPSAENLDAVLLLAILGSLSHLPLILAVAKTAELGPRRFQALGAFGHPGVVATLLQEIGSSDAATAAAAGAAFSKITGADIASSKVATVAAAGDGGTAGADSDSGDSVVLPSVERAQQHWNQVRAAFAKGTRWCRGFDLSNGVSDAILAQLDLESRREACLRGRFDGTWKGSLIDLEAYPQGLDVVRRRRT